MKKDRKTFENFKEFKKHLDDLFEIIDTIIILSDKKNYLLRYLLIIFLNYMSMAVFIYDEKKHCTFTEILNATQVPDSPTLSYHL